MHGNTHSIVTPHPAPQAALNHVAREEGLAATASVEQPILAGDESGLVPTWEASRIYVKWDPL